jgi:hypothetical protein
MIQSKNILLGSIQRTEQAALIMSSLFIKRLGMSLKKVDLILVMFLTVFSSVDGVMLRKFGILPSV